MQRAPRLTVIVPTCDRPDTLRYSLETILAQSCDDLQLVVSDNHSGPETAAVVRSFDDPRITSVRTDRRLGMSAHWDFALAHARGDWITIVGDDDGLLLDGAERFLARADSAGVDAIASQRCMFVWPMADGAGMGDLTVLQGASFEVRDSREWLETILRTGDTYAHLPWIYTGGFVRRRVLDSIRARMGRCFSSINPDIYSAVAVASAIPRYGYSHEPYSIGGTSKHSNGLKCFTTKREDRAQIAFFRENDLQFHPSLGDGFVPSLSLFVYEAYLQSAPLRSFDLPTGMHEQLCLAIALSKDDARPHTVEYCREVARANGLDADGLEAASARLRFQLSARKKMRRLKASLGLGAKPRKTVIRSAAIDTVMAAAREAARQLAPA